ncbi:MAG: hypothetical protein HQL61_00175 [Magnetococcales bacterium]|nr:hypothetical protein [Nitrospirota bacterium]
MIVKAWGTRGSIAISNVDSVEAGGNTTCFEIMSECLPRGARLFVDAGTGFVPAGWNYLSEVANGLNYYIMLTHFHWDHIVGLTLSPPTFIDRIPMTIYGPMDNGHGPESMIKYLFNRPYFPVDAKKISHKMRFVTLSHYDVCVIVVHPIGGFTMIGLDDYKNIIKKNVQVALSKNKYLLSECLVIKMAKTNHGNANCISYRFEENPTGKVAVIATDHEDVAAISAELREHFANADLLIIDSQYDNQRYQTSTAGYGHGTPHGSIKHGIVCKVKKIGFTHHDPRSTDKHLKEIILQEAAIAISKIKATEEFLNTYKLTASDLTLTEEDICLVRDYNVYEV